MNFLLLMWGVVAFVWLSVAVKFWRQRGFPISFCLGGIAVIVSGSVLGYEFFRIESGPIPLTIDRAIWCLLIMVYLNSVVQGRQAIEQWDRMDLLILALLAVLTLSTGLNDWSENDNLSLSRLLFFYLMPIGLYFLVKGSEIRLWDLRAVMICMVAFGVYLGVTALAETRGWYWMVVPGYLKTSPVVEFFGRGRGPFLNPISNGLFMTTCAAFAWVYCQHAGRKGKLISVGAIAVVAVGIFCTMTRSVWLGAIAGAGLLVWIPSRFRTRGLMVVAGGLAALMLITSLGESLSSFKRDKYVTESEMAQSASLRPIFAKVAWEMFKEQPIWGCGFGQYTNRKLSYLSDPHSGMQLRLAKPYMQHNVFLAYLTETGLLGMSWFVAVLGYLSIISMVLWKNPLMSPLARQFGIVMVVFLSNFFINGLFHDVSIIPMANMLLFFMAGITSNLHRQGENLKLRVLIDHHQVTHGVSLRESFIDRNLAAA